MIYKFDISIGDSSTGEIFIRSKKIVSLDTPGIDLINTWFQTYLSDIKNNRQLFLLISNENLKLPIQPTLF